MRITLLIAALVLLSAGIFFSYLDQVSSATATYAAAIFCLIFVFLTEFRRFKGFGVEAELLERKIDEADKILTQLRNITSPISEMLFSLVVRSGRRGEMIPRKQRYDLMIKIESELKSCGVTDTQIEKAKQDWHAFNIHDLAAPIFQSISTRVEYFMGRELQKVSGCEHDSPGIRLADKYRENLNKLKSQVTNINIPKLMLNFIETAEIFDEKTKIEINNEISDSLFELSFYIENKKFNNIEKWFSAINNK